MTNTFRASPSTCGAQHKT